MWLSILVCSIIISHTLLPFPWGQFIALIAIIMTIKSTTGYFKRKKRWASYNYAERKTWDREYYSESRAKKAGQTVALMAVVSIMVVLLMGNYGYMNFDALTLPNQNSGSQNNDGNFKVRADQGTVLFNDRPNYNSYQIEVQIHNLMNEQRRSYGLQPFTWDENLASIARSHSQDMANRDYYNHDSPEGKTFSDRYSQAGYNCQIPIGENRISLGGENILQSYTFGSYRHMGTVITEYNWYTESEIVKTAVTGWMNSPSHKENILKPYYQREGIGMEIMSNNTLYITQNFC